MGMFKWLIEFANTNPGIILIGAVTLVEVVPIKINPWTAILKWIGDKVNGNLQKEVTNLKREFELKNSNDWRWDILDFFNSSRNNRRHSKEEWDHAIDQIKKYERHVEIHGIDNGVLEEAAKWLRNEYQKHIIANDFLDT